MQWQLGALSKKHRVLIYDLPGHGDSPAPAGLVFDFDPEAYDALR